MIMYQGYLLGVDGFDDYFLFFVYFQEYVGEKFVGKFCDFFELVDCIYDDVDSGCYDGFYEFWIVVFFVDYVVVIKVLECYGSEIIM